MSIEVAWLLAVVLVLGQWAWSMYTYHWVWGEWLRLRYAPFALGVLLVGTRARHWEVSH